MWHMILSDHSLGRGHVIRGGPMIGIMARSAHIDIDLSYTLNQLHVWSATI